MTRFRGGETVDGGYYVNVRGWNIEVIDGRSGALPGGEGASYRKLPLPALFVLAPVMGLLFVLIVPFLGVAVLAEQLWKKTAGAVGARRARSAGSAIAPRR
jgi:hypothetical protein